MFLAQFCSYTAFLLAPLGLFNGSEIQYNKSEKAYGSPHISDKSVENCIYITGYSKINILLVFNT